MHALHGIRNVKACILDALRWEAESHSSNAREESPGGPFRFCSFPVSIAVAGGWDSASTHFFVCMLLVNETSTSASYDTRNDIWGERFLVAVCSNCQMVSISSTGVLGKPVVQTAKKTTSSRCLLL